MKLSKKITATAAATALASAALLTPVANAQTAENGTGTPEAPGENGTGTPEAPGENGTGTPGENGANGSSNMSKDDKIAAGIGGTIVGLGVLGAVLGNAGDKAEAPKDGEKEEAPAAEAPAAEAPAKEDIEAPAAEAPAAEAPAVEAAPAEGRNVQLANTGVKPEISILAGLALISMVAGAWMMFSRRQA